MSITDEVRKKLQREYSSGLTQTELAKKYGIDQGYISCVISGKKKPSLQIVEAVLGNGDKDVPQTPPMIQDFQSPDSELSIPEIPRFQPVPVISIAQAAEYEPLEPLVDYLREVSDRTQLFVDVKDNYFAVEISGDSMSPDYPNGSIALVAAGEFPERGDIVVAKFSTGQVVIKEYHRKDNVISLTSRNPSGQNFQWHIKEKPGFIQWMFPVIEIVLHPRRQRRTK